MKTRFVCLTVAYTKIKRHSPKSMRRRTTRRKTLPDSVGLDVAGLEVEQPSPPPPWLAGSIGLSPDVWLGEDGERGLIEESEELASARLLDLNSDGEELRTRSGGSVGGGGSGGAFTVSSTVATHLQLLQEQ